jgi:hypothetical protein
MPFLFVYAHINTDVNTPILQQAFFNAMPEVQERFPEGVVKFAEAAAQMDPEEFKALMLAAMADAIGANGGGSGMSGNQEEAEPVLQEPFNEGGDAEDVQESDGDEEESR